MTDKEPGPLPTVLLHHTTATGDHYDWLLADPNDPDGLLRTFRVLVGSDQWAMLKVWDLQPIQPHRAIYLTYEGPIPGDRGDVRRVDEGTFESVVWRDDRIEIDLAMRGCRGRVVMVRKSEEHWQARLASISI